MRPDIPKAILFDWDNTLIDSWLTIHEALSATFEVMGFPKWTLSETKRRARKSLREAFPELFGDRWRDAEEIFYGHFRANHIETLKPLPGIEPMLESLHAQEIYLGVVSNKNGDYLRRECAHLGWNDYFGSIIGATDAKRDKPSPDPINLCLAGGNITAGPQVWYVGDTEMDMECATLAACVPVLLLDKTGHISDFNGYRPSSEFTTPHDLVRYINK